MKKLVLLALASTLLAGCEAKPSMLEGDVKGGAVVKEAKKGGGGDKDALIASLRAIDERLKSLEAAHTVIAGKPEMTAFERMHRIDVSLARRDESLAFLDMAYTQQKRQEEQKEAQEMDPTGVYAVDISKAIKAGQVEGPTSAIITIVEAWDFA